MTDETQTTIPTTLRKKIPRPWLDRLRTPISLKEQKPEIIWEVSDDWECRELEGTTVVLAPPKKNMLESLQELRFCDGFCQPKHRTINSAPPIIVMEPASQPMARSPMQDSFSAKAAPRVIYIVHANNNNNNNNNNNKDDDSDAVPPPPLTFSPYIQKPVRSFDTECPNVPLVRTASLPVTTRPPRVNRRATSGKPPLMTMPRPRAPTYDSRASSTGSSRHRRSSNDWELTTTSLKQILSPDDDDDVDVDDDSTIQSIESSASPFSALERNQENDRWMMEWASKGPNKFEPFSVSYLPTCPIMLRDYATCSILTSGWLAFSPGEIKGSISRHHIQYMIVLQSERILYFKTMATTKAGQSSQEYESNAMSTTTKLELPLDTHVEMKLASKILGKAIVLKSSDQTLGTLLPVSVTPALLSHGVVAPADVEQHDAALHLMFALDSWIRSSRRCR